MHTYMIFSHQNKEGLINMVRHYVEAGWIVKGGAFFCGSEWHQTMVDIEE